MKEFKFSEIENEITEDAENFSRKYHLSKADTAYIHQITREQSVAAFLSGRREFGCLMLLKMGKNRFTTYTFGYSFNK